MRPRPAPARAPVQLAACEGKTGCNAKRFATRVQRFGRGAGNALARPLGFTPPGISTTCRQCLPPRGSSAARCLHWTGLRPDSAETQTELSGVELEVAAGSICQVPPRPVGGRTCNNQGSSAARCLPMANFACGDRDERLWVSGKRGACPPFLQAAGSVSLERRRLPPPKDCTAARGCKPGLGMFIIIDS